MSYTPGLRRVFEENLTRFSGEGRLAVHVSMNAGEALFSIGEVNYFVNASNDSTLSPKEYRFRKVSELPRESFNGVAVKEMIGAELENLGEYAQCFDVIVHDFTPGNRRIYLERVADDPSKLIKDNDEFKFESL